MFTYLDILKDKEILETYKQIDIKCDYVAAHGIKHIKNVLKLCKNIANVVKLIKEEKRLLYIACVLHDVGRIVKNHNHHMHSEIMAKKYLKGKLTKKEIDIVCNAIKYHSSESAEFEKMDNVAHCLIFADKLDMGKSRLLKNLMYQAITPHFDRFKYCEKIELSVEKDVLVLTVTQNNKKMKKLMLNATEKMSAIINNFIKHFNFKTYKLKFIDAK